MTLVLTKGDIGGLTKKLGNTATQVRQYNIYIVINQCEVYLIAQALILRDLADTLTIGLAVGEIELNDCVATPMHRQWS